MWPWEHLAVGYLLYSPYAHARYGRPPTGTATLLLALATQLPDLVDKPLAWVFGVLPTGLSLAHSLLFAVPLTVAALWLARLAGEPATGTAFGVGYLSHLGGDVVYPVLLGGPPAGSFLLWPLVPAPTKQFPGAIERVRALFADFAAFITSTQGRLYLVLEVTLLGLALAVWIADGHPGVGGGRAAPDRAARDD